MTQVSCRSFSEAVNGQSGRWINTTEMKMVSMARAATEKKMEHGDGSNREDGERAYGSNGERMNSMTRTATEKGMESMATGATGILLNKFIIQAIQMVPVQVPMMMSVNQQHQMDRADINNYESLLVKQTKRGCCQEFMGCEANSEFKIAAKVTPTENVLYALEDTSCFMRFCIPNLRPSTINLSKGEGPGGDKIASFERPLACPIQPCKICCY
jgi:hypothetical protein